MVIIVIATVDGHTSRRRKSSYVARSSACDVYDIIQTAATVAVAVAVAVAVVIVDTADLVVNRQSLVVKERCKARNEFIIFVVVLF